MRVTMVYARRGDAGYNGDESGGSVGYNGDESCGDGGYNG